MRCNNFEASVLRPPFQNLINNRHNGHGNGGHHHYHYYHYQHTTNSLFIQNAHNFVTLFISDIDDMMYAFRDVLANKRLK